MADDGAAVSAEADLRQGPLSNVGMEGFAGVILEETHAEGCDALVRALVHISPIIQEKVHNVEVRMHLESGKDRLVNTGASPQQTGGPPAIHAASPLVCNIAGHTQYSCLALVKGHSGMEQKNEWITLRLPPFGLEHYT